MDHLPILRAVVELGEDVGGKHRLGETLFAGFCFFELADPWAGDLNPINSFQYRCSNVFPFSLGAQTIPRSLGFRGGVRPFLFRRV